MKTIKNAILIAMIVLFSIKLFGKNDKNFMWKIKNGKTTMYLLGSIHMMPENMYPLDEKIEKAFDKSDILYVEVDPANADQQKTQEFIMSKALYPEGKTLKTEMPEELYNQTIQTCNSLGLPEERVNLYKPWFVSLNIAAIGAQKLEMNAGIGIDKHFLDNAKAKNMEICELEEFMAQMKLLTSISDEDQIDYLGYSLDNLENLDFLINEMLESWDTGDTERMFKATKEKMLSLSKDMPGLKNFYKQAFPDRDNKIIVKLDEILKRNDKKTYFVVVGSGHIIGDDGLLQLLKDKGYKPKQM